MSKRILKALMQLFAIIARPDSNARERTAVVRLFLRQQLNSELIEEYLKVFNQYYTVYQKRQSNKEKRKKRTSSSSVRVLKICTEINEELTQQQKIVVLILLLEFIKADNEITEQELEFVSTVSDTFLIAPKQFQLIKNFVIQSFAEVSDNENILFIDGYSSHSAESKSKHLFSESLNGQIRVLYIAHTDMYILRYSGESELYLNGQLVQQEKVYILNAGSSIKNSIIRPIYYSDIVGRFKADTHDSQLIFEVKNLNYSFPNGTLALKAIEFTEKSGRLIGIMGASGTGKTTLLNVLNGSTTPDSGKVLMNDLNVHTEKAKIQGVIGYVSQDDLLIEELSVFHNLFYNAQLCFSDLDEFQIRKRVLNMLKSLGLLEIKDMKVGSPLERKISGGQRKRLNIALELIREPTVMFLDEPTSGLSSRDSENIMDLLKELALKGKLVFVVIHQPSSDIFKMFDRLLLLDMGGYLIYHGDPVDSIIYFKSRIHQANWNESECRICGNVNPEQIFNIVESQVLDEFGNLTYTRRTTPKEWHDYFCEFRLQQEQPKQIAAEQAARELPDNQLSVPNHLKQFAVFVKRDIMAKMSNTQYLIINLLETPILAFLLSYIIKYFSVDAANDAGYTLSNNTNLPVYIFISVIIAVFVGLTVSAQEIIKDRKIHKRESFLNLSRSSYLLSKIMILFSISAIQALIYVLIGNTIIEIHDMYFSYWLVLFFTWASANMMGLIISDSFKTSVAIYIVIPFLIIPQIILSGVIVKYDKLNPNISSPQSIPFYGEIVTSRWAFEALAVKQFKDNAYEKQFYPYDKVMAITEFKKDYWLKTLQNKLTELEQGFTSDSSQLDTKQQSLYENHLAVLRNELTKETRINPYFEYKHFDKLYPDSLNLNIIRSTRQDFKELKEFYIQRYNEAYTAKDRVINAIREDENKWESFLKTKQKYRNKRLADFVTNASELDKIIEYKQHLYAKTDPIYRNPSHPFLKAHFYAPQKRLFNWYIDTFWANILVIIAITVILYIILYYRWLKKLLDFTDYLNSLLDRRKERRRQKST